MATWVPSLSLMSALLAFSVWHSSPSYSGSEPLPRTSSTRPSARRTTSVPTVFSTLPMLGVCAPAPPTPATSRRMSRVRSIGSSRSRTLVVVIVVVYRPASWGAPLETPPPKWSSPTAVRSREVWYDRESSTRAGGGQMGYDAPTSPDKERQMRVIDMECNVPRRAAADGDGMAAATPAVPATPASAAERPAGYGMANYERIFRSRQAGGDPRPDTELAEYVRMLERVGIVRAVPFGATNDEVADLLAEYPDRFIGL